MQEESFADTDECLLVTRVKQSCLLCMTEILTLTRAQTDQCSTSAFIPVNKIQDDYTHQLSYKECETRVWPLHNVAFCMVVLFPKDKVSF